MTDGGWNFGSVWDEVAARFPDALALAHGDREVTWAEMERRAGALARAFVAAEVAPGATVALYLRNGPEYVEALYGTFKAAVSAVNTNYRYGPAELTYLWDDARAEAVVFADEFTEVCAAVREQLPRIRTWFHVGPAASCPSWATPYEAAATAPADAPLDRRPSGDDIFLLYTGGTTGQPKGVMWRHDDLFRMLETQNGRDVSGPADPAGYVAAIERPGPRVLPAAPLMHGTAAWFAMPGLDRGGAVVTLPSAHFDAAELFDVVVARGVKGICIVGDAFASPMLAALDAEPDRWDLGHVRVVFSSGVMFSQDRKDRLRAYMPGATLVDGLGSSESGTMARSISSTDGGTVDTGAFRLGASARVIDDWGDDVPVGGTGRLVTTGHIPLGYFGDPEKTAQTFVELGGVRHVVTGDWAEVHEDGLVRLLGRGSAVINTGGEKVFPEEVEEALKTDPDVVDAAVLGLPDDRFGSAIVALVELRDGCALDERRLIAHVKEQLAGYKAPRQVFAVGSIGRAPNGKLDQRALAITAARLRDD